MLYAFRATVEGKNVTFLETNPMEGKYEAIVILTTPLRTDAVSPADQPVSQSLRPVPQTNNRVPAAGTSDAYTDHSVASKTSPIIPDSGLSMSVNNNLSLLYHDKTKRDARRGSTDDIFVDVNKDTYQRLMQGERIPLVFEKSGNYLNSPFILVENCSQLYINFYQFNEWKTIPLEKEKILSQIFEIKGKLPNCVKACKPALMVPQTGGYVINNKGVLVLEGAV